MSDKANKAKFLQEIKYLSRYAGSGIINTIVGFIVIFSAMAIGASPVISNVAGYAVGFILGFVLSKKFVFRSNGHFVGESVRYLVAFWVAFGMNLLVLKTSIDYFSINAYIAQGFAAVSYTGLMYILTRFLVFQNKG